MFMGLSDYPEGRTLRDIDRTKEIGHVDERGSVLVGA